jgi:hypothetical protein
MEYRVGDIVRIKTLEKLKASYNNYVFERTRKVFFGKPAAIFHVTPATKTTEPLYKIIGHAGLWGEKMIEGLVI